MSFLNPTYLWAFIGLCIPIIIHLWSKKEGKTIKIGSIKLLQEEDSKQSSSILLNEYLLLCLRLLLISILVLILATPRLKKEIASTPLTYIIEPELLKNKRLSPLVDSLQRQGEVRVLQPGFPIVTDTIGTMNEIPNYWKLATQMESLTTDSIIVYTQARSQGLKGKRPTLYKKISWVMLNNETTVNQTIAAIQVGDSLQLITLMSNDRNLSFNKEKYSLQNTTIKVNDTRDSITLSRKQKQESSPLFIRDTIRFMFVVDEAFIDQARYVEAAFKGLSTYLEYPITIEKSQNTNLSKDADFDRLVWFSEAPLENSVTPVLQYQPNPLASSLITQGASHAIFYVTDTLDIENSIGGHLAEQLLSFFDPYPTIEAQIAKYDQRVVDSASILPNTIEKGITKAELQLTDISHWLWILCGIILCSERFIARYRKQ